MQHTTREWQQLEASHHLHPFTDFQALNKKGSRIITKAEGVYLEDSEGKRILDGMAGLWCVNMGYGRQELVDAATRQMQQLPYYNLFFQTSHPPCCRAGHPAGRDHAFPPQPRLLHRLGFRVQRHRAAHGAPLLGQQGTT